MVEYWHGQSIFGPAQDGICQESCRDLGHVELGFATLVNSAETAHHQGIDLYGEAKDRIVYGCASSLPNSFYISDIRHENITIQRRIR